MLTILPHLIWALACLAGGLTAIYAINRQFTLWRQQYERDAAIDRAEREERLRESQATHEERMAAQNALLRRDAAESDSDAKAFAATHAERTEEMRRIIAARTEGAAEGARQRALKEASSEDPGDTRRYVAYCEAMAEVGCTPETYARWCDDRA